MSEETTPPPQSEEKPQKPAAKAKVVKANTENIPQATASKAKATTEDSPPAKAAKKAAIEDKPFGDFIAQDYLPALEKALSAKDLSDLKLDFANNQVSGEWMNGQRQFTIYFPQADINSQRAFSCSIGKTPPSTFEPFLVDERKITLDLLVFGVIQRLNAQKWLGHN
jgi:hypothetical protein